MRPGRLGALILGATLGAPGLGAAACPPMGPSAPSVMDTLLRPSPPSGPRLSVLPPRGPAPLAVDVSWTAALESGAPRVELDLRGDGSFDAVRGLDPRDGPVYGGRARQTFQAPGDFDVALRVSDGAGRVTTVTARVSVVSRADFDQELQAVWSDLRGALRAGDVPAALECMVSGKRAQYRRAFETVLRGGTSVDDVLKDISFVSAWGPMAEYQMLRDDPPRGRLSYPVQFGVDVDGRWRLRSF